ncbi:unnamed protein product [Larinioides sclopetarius]
MSHLW